MLRTVYIVIGFRIVWDVYATRKAAQKFIDSQELYYHFEIVAKRLKGIKRGRK
jgi:hypothetical protein